MGIQEQSEFECFEGDFVLIFLALLVEISNSCVSGAARENHYPFSLTFAHVYLSSELLSLP